MSKNFELLQQIGKEHNLFQTSGSSSVTVKTTDYEPTPTVEITLPKPERKEPKIQTRWPELIKEKAKGWGGEVAKKDLPRALDSDKITRREELKLVQRIFPPGGQRSPQVVIFSGAEHGHAASNICARCCEVLAVRGDGPVCAVDASFGSPFLHRYFGLENAKGLAEALCDYSPIQDSVHNINGTKIWLMPAGTANISLNCSEVPERLKERVSELRTFFKYVMIHSPVYSDRTAAPPSFGADGVVLIVEANSTRRETVREVMEELRILGTPVLGVVLNNRTFPIPDAIYNKL
jgi:Mrp family chromosome partitioning ATPase